MNDINCKNLTLTIKTNDFTNTLVPQFRQIAKELVGVSFKKISKYEYLATFKTDESRSLFIDDVGIYVSNAFLLQELIRYFSIQKIDVSIRELMIESFFEQNTMFIAYIQEIHKTSFADFMKERNVLSVPIYLKFNFPGLKEEIFSFLDSGIRLDELLGFAMRKLEADDDAIIAQANKLRQLVVSSSFKQLSALHCYMIDDEVVIEDDEHIEVNSLTFPDTDIDLDMLNEYVYIVILLMAIQPKKAILYKTLDTDILEGIKEFYVKHKDSFGDMDLYQLDDDGPFDENDDDF